jgi:hypothetical protein
MLGLRHRPSPVRLSLCALVLAVAACSSANSADDSSSGSDGGLSGDAPTSDATDGAATDGSGGGDANAVGADAGSDAGSGDGSTDASMDASGVDAAGDDAGSTVTLLTGAFQLWGVTSDGYAIVTDAATGSPSAVPLGGGASVPFGHMGTTVVEVAGSVAFARSNYDPLTNSYQLTLWTSAKGGVDAASGSPAGVFAAAADGQTVAFGEGQTAAGAFTLAIAHPDGSQAAPGISVGGGAPTCPPQLAFAGPVLAVAACATSSLSSLAITTVTTANGFEAALLQGTAFASTKHLPFSIDAAGDVVAAVDGSGTARALPSNGGAALATQSNVYAAAVVPDGSAMLTITSSGLYRTSLQNQQTAPLVTGVSPLPLEVRAVSPDSNWVFYSSGHTNCDVHDLYQASATAAGSPTPLETSQASALPNLGDSFTTDDAYAVYLDPVATCLPSGVLMAAPLSGGATRMLGMDSVLAYAAGAERIAFNQNYNGNADIYAVDLAQASSPQLLALQAAPTFFMTPPRDAVVYVTATGVYATSIP